MKYKYIILLAAALASGCLPEEEKLVQIDQIVAQAPADAKSEVVQPKPMPVVDTPKPASEVEAAKPPEPAASKPLSLSERAAIARERARQRRAEQSQKP